MSKAGEQFLGEIGVGGDAVDDGTPGAANSITERLATALSAAAEAHHQYEEKVLDGARDEQWAGWYAAYVLGRMGDIAQPSELTGWLTETSGDDWAMAAAEHVAKQLRQNGPQSAPGARP